MPTVHLLIKGKVQGVFYRAHAKEMAKQLHITGWIKNTGEGDVEATVSGSEDALREFTQWCKRGPNKADVTHVIETKTEERSFDGFSIIR